MELVLTLSDSSTSSSESRRRLSQGALTIGRGDGNDWILDDPSRAMSRHHCRIEKREDGFWLIDDSSNGSVVNGKCVKGADQAVRLADGDRLKLGACELCAAVEETQTSTAEAPLALDPFAALPKAGMVEATTPNDPLSISQVISRNWCDQEAASRSVSALHAAAEPRTQRRSPASRLRAAPSRTLRHLQTHQTAGDRCPGRKGA